MPIRVLLVGDADEARWLRMLLDSQGPSPFRIEQTPDLVPTAECLAKGAPDVVLLHIGADKSRFRKAVDGTFGLLEGNRALLETAVILRSCFRQADIVARMGGDEFCVLMTDARQDTAQEVRRRLAQRLERTNAIPGRRYQLSLSVGIANVPVT